jgi:hypothetical protein
MACIKIIDGIKIYIYTRDHNPPHFHAIVAEHEELIVIADLSTYTGKIPTKYRKKVISWAEENKEFLNREWNKLNP